MEDLDRLRVFVAVAETRSFSAAASRLGMPKSSVSREVARLERSMGVRLLHRTTRRVAPSTAGEALLERVAPLLGSLACAIDEVRGLDDEPSGLLRVTATVDFGASVLAGIVARFVARYPRVRVEARITNAMLDLVAEGVDVALRITAASRLESSSLTARRLGTIALELFASPRYLARKGTPRSVEDLERHDVIRFPGEGVEGLAEDRARIVADDMFFVREALKAGAGIGVLPAFLAEEDLASGALVRVLPGVSRRTGNVWLVLPGGRQVSRTVAAFRDVVLEALERRPLDPPG